MKAFNKFKILFISLFIYNFIQSYTFADSQCEICTQITDSHEKECCQLIKKAVYIDEWDGNGNPISIDSLKTTLTDFVHNSNDLSSENKPYVKLLIPAIRKKMTSLVNEKNKQWTEKYLKKIQEYNDEKAIFQNYHDEVSQLKSSIQNYVNQKNRISSLKKVYLQNLAGISKAFLILGKGKWPGRKEDITPMYVLNFITKKAKEFIASKLTETLIYSETEIKNAEVSKSVVQSSKMVRIEEFETDPYYFIPGSVFYVLHKYRSYPMYIIQDKKNTNNVGRYNDINIENVKHWNIDNTTIHQYQKKHHFSKGLLDEMYKQIQLVENENTISIQQIEDFEQSYTQSRDKIELKKDNLYTEIKTLTDKIQKRFSNKFLSDFKINITDKIESLTESYEKHEENEKIQNHIIGWLEKRKTIFKKRKENAKEAINKWLENRNMIVFTVKSEINGLSELPSKVMKRLLSSATNTLTERIRQLISYEISTVKNGTLESHKAKDFYNDGLPVRYFILPPVLKYLSKPGETPLINYSLFLAWEVQYTEKDKKLNHQNQVQKLNNIYFDDQNNLSWFFGDDECYLFDKAKNLVPVDYKMPEKKHFQMLHSLIKNNKFFAIRNNYTYLTQPGSEIWTGEKSTTTDKLYTYIPNANEFSSHHTTFCGYVVGVKSGK